MHTPPIAPARRHPRYTVHASITLVGVDRATLSPVQIEGYTVDISRGGLSAHVPTVVRPGMKMVALITQSGVHLIATGEVRNMRYEVGLGHLMGLAFSEDLLGNDLRGLLDAVSGGRRLRDLLVDPRARRLCLQSPDEGRRGAFASLN